MAALNYNHQCPCSHCYITEISFIEYNSVFYNFDKCKLPLLSGLLFLFGIFLFFIRTLKFTVNSVNFVFRSNALCPLTGTCNVRT